MIIYPKLVADLKNSYSTTSPASSVRKLNYPLTPSSDTSETVSVVNDIIHMSNMPGESGDSVDGKPLLV